MFAEANGFVVRACLLAVGSLIFVSSTSAATPTLQIVGTPPTEAPIGQWYIFSPGATLFGSGSMQFSIENKPRWATFNTTWGRLDGAPQDSDVGSYEGIRISVSNGTERVSLPVFAIKVRTQSGSHSVSLRWDPPLLNEDGSALTNLAGYRIYIGPTARDLTLFTGISNGGLTRFAVQPLAAGTHFFAMSAVNSAGVESRLSPAVSTTLR